MVLQFAQQLTHTEKRSRPCQNEEHSTYIPTFLSRPTCDSRTTRNYSDLKWRIVSGSLEHTAISCLSWQPYSKDDSQLGGIARKPSSWLPYRLFRDAIEWCSKFWLEVNTIPPFYLFTFQPDGLYGLFRVPGRWMADTPCNSTRGRGASFNAHTHTALLFSLRRRQHTNWACFERVFCRLELLLQCRVGNHRTAWLRRLSVCWIGFRSVRYDHRFCTIFFNPWTEFAPYWAGLNNFSVAK